MSNIPTRRVTRTTRTTVVKDSENAITARPLRTTTTRAKPHSSTAIGAASTRATAATAASRAKLGANGDKTDPAGAGKRKREALGELTGLVTNNKVKGAGAKGKEKEKVVAPVKKTTETATTTTTTRQPLRTVASTRQTAAKSKIIVAKEEEVEVVVQRDEHAMLIDHPRVAPVPAPAPIPLPRVPVRRSPVRKPPAPRYSPHQVRRPSSSRIAVPPPLEDEEESTRVFKKRRTSSEAPEEAVEEEEEAETELSEEAAAAEQIAAELQAYADAEPEADPEGSDWDDLDAEDADDPLMVSEYVVDIFKYMKSVEPMTMPNPNYMASQKELAWKMRGILTDWLIQVHVRFRLLPETLFLCTNIIDRFLSARVVSLAKLQLVGVTCMFIAAKFEEVVAPSVTHFLKCADSSYTENEILQAERYVLKTLDWNLSTYPNPVGWLRRVSKADDYDVKVRTVGKYLLEIGVVEWRLIGAPPSLMAATSIWLGRLALGREEWTPNLAHYSSYPESALIPTANLMINYILKPIRHESFHKKYAGKRYYKSSIYMREWALERWDEGAQVDLSKELPTLKAEIRIEKARLEAEERELQLAQEDSDS